MRDVNSQNFGYIIAFLLPGFIVLAGVASLSEMVDAWVGGDGDMPPTIGGFLYGTLAAIAAGIIASTVRWLLLDTLHHLTGIPPPNWNYAKLQSNSTAFEVLKQDHYRFYQFYGNSAVALPVAWVSFHLKTGFSPAMIDLVFIGLILICYLGSRDTLKKYYSRVRDALN